MGEEKGKIGVQGKSKEMGVDGGVFVVVLVSG